MSVKSLLSLAKMRLEEASGAIDSALVSLESDPPALDPPGRRPPAGDDGPIAELDPPDRRP